MARKNSLLRKASWLGFKYDFHLAIYNICDMIQGKQVEKMEEYENEQSRILEEFEKSYKSKDEKEEKE